MKKRNKLNAPQQLRASSRQAAARDRQTHAENRWRNIMSVYTDISRFDEQARALTEDECQIVAVNLRR